MNVPSKIAVPILQGSVEDNFDIQGDYLETPYARSFKAIMKSNRRSVLLWLGASPVQDEANFLDYLTAIVDSGLSVVEGAGLTNERIPYVAIPFIDGHKIVQGNIETREGERRVLSAIKAIDKLHKKNVCSGNISESSFWIARGGEFNLIGILPTLLGGEPIADSSYVAPEVRSSGVVTSEADVYSLGVLAYKLLSGQDYQGNYIPLSEYVDVPPVWGDTVIAQCLSPDPAMRPKNAKVILNEITASRTRTFKENMAPAQIQKSLTKGKGSGNKMMVSRAISRSSLPQKMEQQELKRVKSSKLLAVGAVVAVCCLGLLFFVFGRKVGPTVHQEPAVLVQTSTGETIDVREDNLSELKAKLLTLKADSNPEAHWNLIQLAKDADSVEKRQLVEKTLIDRCKENGYVKSSHQVLQWIRNNSKDKMPLGYESVLKSLDPIAPMEEKAKFLKSVYPKYPKQILRLAAALAFESGDLESYQGLLSQLVGDNLQIDDANERSALALVLAHEQLSLVFADDIVQYRPKLSDEDILWVLGKLGKRGDVNTRAIAKMALERGLLKKIRKVFASIIHERSDLSAVILNSLIKAVSGSYDRDTIDSFGRWYDRDAEKVLLAVSADVETPDLMERAFEITAGKNIVTVPSADIVEWVRANDWDNRGKYTNLVGIIANLDSFSEEKFIECIKSLDNEIRKTSFRDVLIKSKHPDILRVLLRDYPLLINLTTKLSLLRHPNKELKIAVIKAINTNNIGALQQIKKSFDREKDEEVKEAYRKHFWVIKGDQR